MLDDPVHKISVVKPKIRPIVDDDFKVKVDIEAKESFPLILDIVIVIVVPLEMKLDVKALIKELLL